MSAFDLSKCKPFDLERAKAGDPIVTRDGRPGVWGAYNPDARPAEQVVFWVNGTVRCCSIDGLVYGATSDSYAPSIDDLFMAPKKKTYWVGVARSKSDGRLWTTNPKPTRDEAIDSIKTAISIVVDVFPIEIEE